MQGNVLIAKVAVFDDTVMLRTPYVPAFVDALKLEIPWQGRKWDPATKIWEVDPLYKNLAIDICKRYFDVEIDDQSTPTQRQIQPPGQGDWAGVLFDAIPEALHKSVYRRLCLVLHPDQGGDTALIQVLTEAYARRHQ